MPYPDMISQVGERVVQRSKDEFIQTQILQYRKEEQENELVVSRQESEQKSGRMLASQ